MDKIFTNDSQWCTVGVGFHANNCGNIRLTGDNSPVLASVYDSGQNGIFAKYDTVKNGIRAAVELYARRFSGRQPNDITRIWAGSPSSQEYWKAVNSCFQ